MNVKHNTIVGRNRRGVATLWLILLMPVLVLLLCKVVDIGKLWLERAALENTLEIAALSAVKEWGDLGPSLGTIDPASAVGIAFAAANTICGESAVILGTNLVYGTVTTEGSDNIFHIGDYTGCGGGSVFIQINKPNAGADPPIGNEILVEFQPGSPNVYIQSITFTIPQMNVNANQQPYFNADASPIVSQAMGDSSGLDIDPVVPMTTNWWCCGGAGPCVGPIPPFNNPNGDICFGVDDLVPFDTNRYRTLIIGFEDGTFTENDFFRFGVRFANMNPPAVPGSNRGGAWGALPVAVSITFVNTVTNQSQTVTGNFTTVNVNISEFLTQGTGGSRPAVHAMAQYRIPSLCGMFGPYTVSARTNAVYDCGTGRVELIRVHEFRENGLPVPEPPFPPVLPP